MSKYHLKDISSEGFKTKRYVVVHSEYRVGVGDIFWDGLSKSFNFYALSKTHYSVDDLKEIITLMQQVIYDHHKGMHRAAGQTG